MGGWGSAGVFAYHDKTLASLTSKPSVLSASNPSICKVEAGGLEVRGHAQLHSQFAGSSDVKNPNKGLQTAQRVLGVLPVSGI